MHRNGDNRHIQSIIAKVKHLALQGINNTRKRENDLSMVNKHMIQ